MILFLQVIKEMLEDLVDWFFDIFEMFLAIFLLLLAVLFNFNGVTVRLWKKATGSWTQKDEEEWRNQ